MISSLTDLLYQRKDYLIRIISSKKAALSGDLPEGRLRCSLRKGKPRFYCVTKAGDTTGKYLREEQHQLAVMLAQKDYDKAALEQAAGELRVIDRLLRVYEGDNVDSLYEKLSPVRRELIEPVTMTDEQVLEKWNAISYKIKGFAENTPVFLTAKGERVRSKSEVMIADGCYRKGIPYYYEHPLQLIGYGLAHPDFKLLNLRLRKVFYWEHCGRLDDPNYTRDLMVRLNAYAMNGYYPGDNLILTGETANCPLETTMIENTILHYLV